MNEEAPAQQSLAELLYEAAQNARISVHQTTVRIPRQSDLAVLLIKIAKNTKVKLESERGK